MDGYLDMQLPAGFIEGMNLQERRDILSAVQQRFGMVDPYLTEQSRRMWAAAEGEPATAAS